MPNQNPNGRNVAVPDENRPSWRPQDQMYRSRAHDEDRRESWREREDREDDRYTGDRGEMMDRGRWGGDRDQRWGGGRESRLGRHWEEDRDEGYRMTERYGQGQSGYAAGRYGEDRALGYQTQGRNVARGPWDARQPGMGIDDRFTGRGGGSWIDQEDRQPRGYNPERYGAQGGYGGGRGFEDRMGSQQHAGYTSGYGQGHGFGNYGDESMYGQREIQQGRYGYGPQGPGPGRSGGFMQSTHYGRAGYPQAERYGYGGPHRGKGPQGYQRTDERIREMVCEALMDDDMIDATNIVVEVSSGEVVLSGTVEDRQTKRMAEDVADRVPGVTDVQNQLRVQSDKGQRAGQVQGPGPTRSAGQGNPPGQGSVGTQENDADRKHRA